VNKANAGQRKNPAVLPEGKGLAFPAVYTFQHAVEQALPDPLLPDVYLSMLKTQ
jgi:hypothetical protein